MLFIVISWFIIWFINLKKLIKNVWEYFGKQQEEDDDVDKFWKIKICFFKSWAKIVKQYVMEWKMVWKDVIIGFIIVGIVVVFVLDSFFCSLFINSGLEVMQYSFLSLLEYVIIGLVVAFMIFIGFMGNILLVVLLFSKGVSFVGVMVFIFSDFVVFLVLCINVKYYGWWMLLFILFLLFSLLIGIVLVLYYGFDLLGYLFDLKVVSVIEMEYFKIDYIFFFNFGFLLFIVGLVYYGFFCCKDVMYYKEMVFKSKVLE